MALPSPESPTIRLITTPNAGVVGDEFTTTIYADRVPAPGLGSWQVRIEFDQAVINLENIQFGDDLFSTGRAKLFELSNVDTPGAVLLSQSSLPPGDGPVGDGIHLVTLHWRAVGNGLSPLALEPGNSQRLVDVDGHSLSPLTLVGSEITVESAFHSLWLPLLSSSGSKP